MNEHFDDLDWTLLDRCLAGEATADEQATLERWSAAAPGRAAFIDRMREGGVRPDVDAAWASLRGRVDAGSPSTDAPPVHGMAHSPEGPRANVIPLRAPRPSTHARVGRRARSRSLRAAALAAVAFSGLVLWRLNHDRGPRMVEVTAAAGVDSVSLPDGSLVILAAGSRLRHPPRFDDVRPVTLDGEALFDVASDATRPFTVDAGGVRTRVLGTRFTVRARADETTVRVAVAEGRVSVRAASADSAVLSAGESAVAAAGAVRVEPASADAFAWADGRLDVRDAPLAEVLAGLSRWHDVTFASDPRLADRRVNGRFTAGSLDETLDALALAIGARHTRVADTITLTPLER